MRLSHFVIISLVTNFIISLACYFVIDTETIVTFESIVYLFFITSLLIFFLNTVNNAGYPLIIVLIVVVFQKYCLSAILLLILPEYGANWQIERFTLYTADHYIRTLRYAVLGTMAVGTGLLLGTRDLFSSEKIVNFHNLFFDRITLKISEKAILIYVIILTLSIYWTIFVLGIIPGIGSDNPLTIFRLLQRRSIANHLILAILFFGWSRLKKKKKSILFISLAIVFAASIMKSSRSDIYVIILMVLFLSTVIQGNLKINGKYIFYSLIGIIIACVVYPIGTAIRYVGRYSYINAGSIIETLKWMYFTVESPVIRFFVHILVRLSEIAAEMRIMNDMQVVEIGDLLSITNELKRIINNLVPGDLFNDVMYPQYIWKYLYWGKTDKVFSGAEWGVWEYFYLMFGYWGGLLVSFVAMIIIGRLWKKILFGKNPIKLFLIVTFLYYFWIFIMSFGLAYEISSFLVELIVFMVIIQVLRVLDLGMGIFSLRPTKLRPFFYS